MLWVETKIYRRKTKRQLGTISSDLFIITVYLI